MLSHESQPTTITRVSLLLAGEQPITISSRHARTEEARAVLSWSTVMLTFSTVAQVAAVREAFLDAHEAARLLPVRAPAQAVQTTVDYPAFLPAVSVVFTATPQTVVVPGSERNARGGWVHKRQWVDLRLGGLTPRIVDSAAYTSGLATITEVLLFAEAVLGTR